MGHAATLQPATAATPCADAHFTSDRSCQMQTLPRLPEYTKSIHGLAQAICHRVRPVMPEEYDEAVRRCPDLCPLVLVGDRRTGSQVAAPH